MTLRPDRLARALARAHLRPADLARELRVHQSTVSRWLGGAALPPSERIDEIASVLGCSPEYLASRGATR